MQLQKELLENLGLKMESARRLNDLTAANLQESDGWNEPSYYLKLLRCYLVDKKMLIVLDDLWEVEVMNQLFANTKGVRYLVTSQIKDIWIASRKVELKQPTKTEARHILANHTKAFLHNKGAVPGNLQVGGSKFMVFTRWRVWFFAIRF
jgi:hypothetical protein